MLISSKQFENINKLVMQAMSGIIDYDNPQEKINNILRHPFPFSSFEWEAYLSESPDSEIIGLWEEVRDHEEMKDLLDCIIKSRCLRLKEE